MLNKLKFYQNSRKAQEEMVGFVIIMIIVAIIMLIFVGFSINNKDNKEIEDYQINSFIQAFLHYTTDCANGYEPRYYDIRRLIIACYSEEKCLNEKESCDVLNSTLTSIIEESWKIDESRPIKGYSLDISSDNEEILKISKGNITNNYRSSVESLGKNDIKVYFTAYY